MVIFQLQQIIITLFAYERSLIERQSLVVIKEISFRINTLKSRLYCSYQLEVVGVASKIYFETNDNCLPFCA